MDQLFVAPARVGSPVGGEFGDFCSGLWCLSCGLGPRQPLGCLREPQGPLGAGWAALCQRIGRGIVPMGQYVGARHSDVWRIFAHLFVASCTGVLRAASGGCAVGAVVGGLWCAVALNRKQPMCGTYLIAGVAFGVAVLAAYSVLNSDTGTNRAFGFVWSYLSVLSVLAATQVGASRYIGQALLVLGAEAVLSTAAVSFKAHSWQ